MQSPAITAELSQWIIAEATTGRDPRAVTAAMVEQGWDEQAAIDAIETVMRDYLAEHAKRHDLPVPTPVPAPIELNGPSVIRCVDREVQVLAHMLHPRIIVFGNVLSREECGGLVALARERLRHSSVFNPDTGADEPHEARTSEGMFFSRGETHCASASKPAWWPCSTGRWTTAKDCRSCAMAQAPSTGLTTTISTRPVRERR